MVVGLESHPALKNLAGASHIAQHLLHVDVFVPELVYARQQADRTIPHVARMVDKAVPHLHLCILQPHLREPALELDPKKKWPELLHTHRGVGICNLQGALPDGARPTKVLLRLLPLCILRHQA